MSFVLREEEDWCAWILDVTIAEERPWDERECVEPKRVTGGKIMARWRRPAQPREAEGRRSGGNGDDDRSMIGEVQDVGGAVSTNG